MGLIWGLTVPLLYWDVKYMSGHKDDGQSSYREPCQAEEDRPSLSEEATTSNDNLKVIVYNPNGIFNLNTQTPLDVKS